MKKPKALARGARIAAVSLSSGMAGEPQFAHRFETAQRRLFELYEFDVRPQPNALRGLDYLDRNPRARAEDWMAALEDSSIDAVFCMIGGDDTIRLLPHVDLDLMARHPKIFLGYSDTTSNHFMMQKAGVISFYGPSLLMEFAENTGMHDYTRNLFERALMQPFERLDIPPSPGWTSEYLPWDSPANNAVKRELRPDGRGHVLLQGEGVARGQLLGGCLEVFSMLIGTALWPSPQEWEGKILLLEPSEDQPRPEVLLYLLRNLAAQGIIDRLAGILFGRPYDLMHEQAYWEVLRRAVGQEAGRPDLPILCNMSFGHTAPICTLPLGAQAEIDCAARSLTLLERPVV